MKVYHGTAWKLGEKIQREAMLNPRPGNRYVYVTTDKERAKLYAQAWTAAYLRDIAPLMNVDNPLPEGCIIEFEMDNEFVEEDPYNPEGEPDQYRIEGTIYTYDAIFEKISFPKLRNSGELLRAYTFWLGVARAIDGENIEESMKKLFEKKKFKSYSEFDKDTTEAYPPPEHVVQPAKDDKGYALVSSAFKKMKRRYRPGISF